MDEQMPSGYYLQASQEGRRWCLYEIRKWGDCRMCEINVSGDQLDIQMISSSYGATLESWNAGVQEQMICTNRIIELLWQHQAPQEISDLLATWHREEEARDFAALQKSTSTTFAVADEESDFREWMDALSNQRNVEVELSAEERLHGGLNDFYAQEAEMERQLGGGAEALWLDQWEVPEEPWDLLEEENLVLEIQLRQEYEEYLDEFEPETPSYCEWDDMDNLWNQECAFEEMSYEYDIDENH